MTSGPGWNYLPVALCVFAFFLGSLPFGIWIAKLYHVEDLRSKGSGNIGATNVSRVAGFWPAGLITLLLDTLKGALPSVLALPAVSPHWSSFYGGGVEFPGEIQWLAALCAVAGHCFSPWLRFQGGKGVATGFGAIVVLSPAAALAGAIAFLLTFLNRRMGSISSLIGLGTAALTHLTLYRATSELWPAAFIIFIIVLRHEKNIDALLENRERQF